MDFVRIQLAVYELYVDYLDYLVKRHNLPSDVAAVDTRAIPYPRYLKSSSVGSMNMLEVLGMLVITSYIIMCPLIVKRICDEKAAKAKEMLKMMVFLCVGFGGLPFVVYSNAFVLLIALVLFNINTILNSMFITTMFNRPVIGVVVSVIWFEVSHAVPMGALSTMYNQDIDVEGTTNSRILSCFQPNSAMQWMFTVMGQCETYVLLIWYVDNVWPWQFGIPKPVHYPFLLSYWFPNRGKTSDTNDAIDANNGKNLAHFEREPLNTRVGIKCAKLHKMFGNKTAVGDMSLNIYGGQITVLLGHNGAGKTTTMNMITGIFPPTSGTAYIDGYDIRQQTRRARKSLGLCPQENILYSELDVSQHLKLYAILKGHPWADVDKEVQKMAALVDLTDKANTMSNDLSGGMKRKLSLGIAMIGNTEILILDEPTSGMDPEARRHMWDVLQNIRSERTILLTTHYMEEADALGDRIVIMSEGHIKCYGSPMFLKKAFGAGYHLRIAKNREFNSQSVLNIIRKTMPNADIKSEINSEIIYSLEDSDERERNNNESTTSRQLIQLFAHLETNKQELNIETFGLTVTTMEDVFLRVGNEYMDNSSADELSKAATNSPQDTDLLSHNITKNTGNKLMRQQFWALFMKRFHYAKRYWPMIVLQTVLPAILFMCILLLDQSLKRATTETSTVSLELNLKSMYGPTEGFIQSALKDFNDKYIKVSTNKDVKTQVITVNPNNWTLSGNRGDDITKYINTYLVGAQINTTAKANKTSLILIPWYNKEAIHSLPVSINFIYETLLKQKFNDKPSITLYNHPILSDQSANTMGMIMVTMVVTCLLLVPLTVPFIGASYALFPIHERITQSKLLQLMNGISVHTFWAASYLFDIINHLLASIILFIVFAIFDCDKIFMGNASNAGGLFLLFLMFGLSAIPLAYLFSLRLKQPSTGYAVLVVVYLLSGIALSLTVFFVSMQKPKAADALEGVANIMPVYAMSHGIQKLYKLGSYADVCNKMTREHLAQRCDNSNYRIDKSSDYWGCCVNLCKPTHECYYERNAFQWGKYGIVTELVYMIVTAFVYLLILSLIESNFQKIKYMFNKNSKITEMVNNGYSTGQQNVVLNVGTGGQDMDSDVSAEMKRIKGLVGANRGTTDAIVVQNLCKTFKAFPAVDNLSFGVHKEECFGLLGVNGAGKT
ncbi:unnamed protein product, partial [Medioppia subpectinata]